MHVLGRHDGICAFSSALGAYRQHQHGALHGASGIVEYFRETDAPLFFTLGDMVVDVRGMHPPSRNFA